MDVSLGSVPAMGHQQASHPGPPIRDTLGATVPWDFSFRAADRTTVPDSAVGRPCTGHSHGALCWPLGSREMGCLWCSMAPVSISHPVRRVCCLRGAAQNPPGSQKQRGCWGETGLVSCFSPALPPPDGTLREPHPKFSKPSWDENLVWGSRGHARSREISKDPLFSYFWLQ